MHGTPLRAEAGGGEVLTPLSLTDFPHSTKHPPGPDKSLRSTTLLPSRSPHSVLARFVEQRASKREDSQGQGDREFLEQQ